MKNQYSKILVNNIVYSICLAIVLAFFNINYYITDIEDLGELLCDLNDIAAFWFTVGLLLKVPYSKLKVIRKDHRDSEDCLREMLATWLQSGEASASELVNALKLAGMSVLSKKTAVKHGEKACRCV